MCSAGDQTGVQWSKRGRTLIIEARVGSLWSCDEKVLRIDEIWYWLLKQCKNNEDQIQDWNGFKYLDL